MYHLKSKITTKICLLDLTFRWHWSC